MKPAERNVPSSEWAYRLRQLYAHDVDEHAHNLSGWEQLYDQLAAGVFSGSLQELWMDDIQVFRERTSHAVRQSCRVRPDSIWCGITVAPDGTRIGGREVGAEGVMIRPGGVEFELLTPSNHDIFGLVASRQALESFSDAIGAHIDWQGLDQAEWFGVDSQRKQRALDSLESLLGEAARTPVLHQHEAARLNLEQSAMCLLVGLLETPEAAPHVCGSFERRRRLVARVRDYVLAEREEVHTIPELCVRFGVSRRSLQYAFEDVLGQSPVSYLRNIRLNGVRRDLRQARCGSVAVQDVAAAWGFWNLSQFSCDYRQLFGERPSDTLRA